MRPIVCTQEPPTAGGLFALSGPCATHHTPHRPGLVQCHVFSAKGGTEATFSGEKGPTSAQGLIYGA